MSSVRVLVVDDYEPFRRFVRTTLEKRPELQIVREASDGLEAVRASEELRPDLIILDIGLPTLNGIEAARRIRKLSAESKILFVSQESSWDVVQEALSSGGLGYVVKAYAARELVAAVEALCQGGQYIGSGISDPNRTGVTPAQNPKRLFDREPIPTPSRGNGAGSHAVQFYADDESLLVGFTRFIEAALKVGNAVVVVATGLHHNHLVQRLQARGLNIGAAIGQGTYIPLNVAETLSTFIVDDLPDPVRFHKVASDLLATAAKAAKGENPRIAACGECAPTLWAQGNADAAVQVEHLWDEITKITNIDILCGYVLSTFQREQESQVYERICAEHSVVYPRDRDE